jgi:hypothetical protein
LVKRLVLILILNHHVMKEHVLRLILMVLRVVEQATHN